jgi:hypothetical protein
MSILIKVVYTHRQHTSIAVTMASFQQRDGFVSITHNLVLPNSFDSIELTPAYPIQTCMRACAQMSSCGMARHVITNNTSKCTRFFVYDTTYKCYLKHSNITVDGSIGDLSKTTNYTLDECKARCYTDDTCVGVNFKDLNTCIPIYAEGSSTGTFMWLQNKTELDRAPIDPIRTTSSGINLKLSTYILIWLLISWMLVV